MMAVLMPWLSDKDIELGGVGRRGKSNPGVSSERLYLNVEWYCFPGGDQSDVGGS